MQKRYRVKGIHHSNAMTKKMLQVYPKIAWDTESKLLKLYGSTNDKKKHRDLANQLNEMQKQYNVTWDHCRNAMIHIGKKYSIDAVFALTKAEDIWRGIEKCLYNNGKTIHFLNMVSCLVSGQNR